jgi:hypothetical protein
MMRFARLIGVGLVGLALAGCPTLPQPFAHRGPVTQNALVELPSGDGVRVVVLDGLEPEIADPLRKAAIKALGDAGIPASSEPTLSSGYVLTGTVQVEDPDDGAPEAARFVWQLTGRDGQSLGAFDKQVSGSRSGWFGRDPALFDAVAKDVTAQVAALLVERGAAGAQSAALAPGIASGTIDGVTEAAVAADAAMLFFEGVTGAPGDGDESLARAMTSVLKRSGVPLAASADAATHLLAATVGTVAKDSSVSEVTIEWHLATRGGEVVGTISQKNPVRTAMIDKRWGELAHIVASAAADGVLDAFEAALTPALPESGKKLAQPQSVKDADMKEASATDGPKKDGFTKGRQSPDGK